MILILHSHPCSPNPNFVFLRLVITLSHSFSLNSQNAQLGTLIQIILLLILHGAIFLIIRIKLPQIIPQLSYCPRG